MTNKTYLAHRRAYTAKENVKPYALTTWLILIALFIGLASVKAQSDSLVWGEPLSIYKGGHYKAVSLHDSIAKRSRYLIGNVIDDGSPIQIRTSDTIPVVMMVSDTAANKHQTQSHFYLSEYKPRTKENFSILDLTDGQLVEISTPMHYQPYIIYGYEVTEKQYYSPTGGDLKIRTNSTTYLNHKKQPLPDRLIVWMAIRRNER
jgi:hypothetical protein